MERQIQILHLSDLHFSGSADADAKIVISALIKDIELEVKTSQFPFDLVVFSGDLVQRGNDEALIDEAKSEFVDKVTKAAGASSDRFVICPGNHDIDRDRVQNESWSEIGLLTVLKSKSAINDFVKRHTNVDIVGDLPEPFQRLKHFYKKVWGEQSGFALLPTPFVSAFNFPVLSQNIGGLRGVDRDAK